MLSGPEPVDPDIQAGTGLFRHGIPIFQESGEVGGKTAGLGRTGRQEHPGKPGMAWKIGEPFPELCYITLGINCFQVHQKIF